MEGEPGSYARQNRECNYLATASKPTPASAFELGVRSKRWRTRCPGRFRLAVGREPIPEMPH